MKTRTKQGTTLRPLAEVIARDARNKKALNAEFAKFYVLMKKNMAVKPELRHLNIALETIKRSVQNCAWGECFGDVLVKVFKHKD